MVSSRLAGGPHLGGILQRSNRSVPESTLDGPRSPRQVSRQHCDNLTGTLAVAAYRDPVNFARDRKSTRLNSSHVEISYAVFCLKKKKKRFKQPQNKKKTIYLSK